MLAAFAERGIDMVIDWEHATEVAAPKGEPAPAAAWIDQLELRSGALWGHVAWTPRAGEQVVAREYRFVSPYSTTTTPPGESSGWSASA